MTKFELVLKNKKVKQYDRIAVLMVIINLIAFIVWAKYSTQKDTKYYSISGATFCILILLGDLLQRAKQYTAKLYKTGGLLLIGLTWMCIGNWWMMAVCFALSFLYRISNRPLAISITDEEVIYPSFPRKEIQWTELSNLVLKDGLLTIDFKNNKLLQAEIINSVQDINEAEFNAFCRRQLGPNTSLA